MSGFESEILKYAPSKEQLIGIEKMLEENQQCWLRVEAKYAKKRSEAEKLKKRKK